MSGFPDWAEFTPERVVERLPRLLADAEREVAAIEASSPADYEGFVWALDDATRELHRCWGMLGHMMGVMNSDAWRKVQEDFQPQVVTFMLRVSQSPKLYSIAKSLCASATGIRRRILDRMVQEAELAGVALEGEKKLRFNEIQMSLARLASDFHNAVIDATTPEISDANYPETMKHDPDRAKRERLYRLRVARAPENQRRIDEILALRREMAALLGFGDYAELSLAMKCAPSSRAVFDMIDRLDVATAAKAEAEKLDGEPWDLAYLAERIREERYAYSEDELKRYFEFEAVLAGLWRMVKFLFDVEVREVTGDAKPSVWHADVRFFEIVERGETIAHFYVDPYVRTGLKGGGAWMNEFRNRSVRGNRRDLPLATLVLNLPLPDADGRCLMPFREVETLFHEFGHALQCCLTRVDEEDAAGVNLVEWDAVEVASQFMENWCLDDRTGISVPPELKAKVRAAKNYRAATACRRQLAFAKTDMLLHSAGFSGDADKLKREVFVHFGLPMIAEDRFLCAFSHIFAGGYAAGYYGYKWAEVMSADCYGAFEEAGLGNDAAMRELGRRYRETVLALGGGESALEVFRRFRGRDPEISSLLRQQDLS